MLHSTRGGAARLDWEFDATLGWFGTPVSQVSAHSVAGEGIIARCVDPDLIAWHCRARNQRWLGIEFVQPFKGNPIDDAVLDAAAWECATWVLRYGIPIVHSLEAGFCQHYETPEGIADGKTDVEAPFDLDAFLSRVADWYAILG